MAPEVAARNAWVSALSASGQLNLSPYSFFNGVGDNPEMVMFSSFGRKDALTFAEEGGEFVCNLAGHDLREAMNASTSAQPAGVSEFDLAGVTAVPCETIDCARVAEAAASIECRATRIIRQAGEANHVVLGVVTGVHIRPDCLKDGIFRPATGWLARLGHNDYCVVTDTFSMDRPA